VVADKIMKKVININKKHYTKKELLSKIIDDTSIEDNYDYESNPPPEPEPVAKTAVKRQAKSRVPESKPKHNETASLPTTKKLVFM
jgi:hypothetical protein